MEKKLYDDSVISLAKTIKSSKVEVYTNKSFIQLEATLLDMASYPDLCKGIMYMFYMELDEKHIVRYCISCPLLISKILKGDILYFYHSQLISAIITILIGIIESGCNRGFVEHNGRQIIAREMKIRPESPQMLISN